MSALHVQAPVGTTPVPRNAVGQPSRISDLSTSQPGIDPDVSPRVTDPFGQPVRHTPFHTLMRGVCTVLLLFAIAGGLPLEAQARGPATAEDPWEDARNLYRAQEFERALPFIIEAIQREPERGELYLGLARTFFQLGRLDEAVWTYDLYLRQFATPEGGDTAASRQARERALAERSSANEARPNPETAAALPPAQDNVRGQFLERLREGPVIAARGGGAFALWETLLRTGYARPDLVDLRRQLVEATRAEALATLPHDARTIPALSLQEWEAQRSRYLLVLERPPEEEGEEWRRLRAGARFVDGQIRMLNDAPEAAVSHFDASLEADARFVPAHLGRLNALLDSADPPAEQLARAMAALEEVLLALEVRDHEAIVLFYRAAAARVLDDVPATARRIDVHLRRAQQERVDRARE